MSADGGRRAVGEQVAGARRRERGQHRQPERAADLLGRVDEARGQPGVGSAWRPTSRASSATGTPGRRRRRAAASPGTRRSGSRASTGARWKSSEADRDRARGPGSSVARAPKRRISRAETPERQRADGERDRQEREADLDRVVAEHALQVERAEEEHPEHPGDHQRLDQVRHRDDRASGRCAAASAACACVASRAMNAPSSATATAPRPSVCSEPQPWSARADDRVDAEHQRAHDQQRAGQVRAAREPDALVVREQPQRERPAWRSRSGR